MAEAHGMPDDNVFTDWCDMAARDRFADAVSSFGSLKYFRAEERPEGAADRCLDCGVEADCPSSS
jgi:hypothetical protein